MIIWKIGQKLFVTSNHIILLLFEILLSWITLSAFEMFSLLNFSIFSTFTTGNNIPYSFSSENLFAAAWINLIVICIFYSYIGLQAYRKNRNITRFVSRLVYGFLELTILAFEGILILIPFGLVSYILNLDNFPVLLISILIYSYNALLLMLLIEIGVRINERTKKEVEDTGKRTSLKIFLMDTLIILIPLITTPTLIVVPFFIPLVFIPLWIYLMLVFTPLSFVLSLLYSLSRILSPLISKGSISRFSIFKYYLELFIASRGKMFDYPKPIDIFIEQPEKVEHLWEKVSLKVACGQCYHVFTAETYKKGSNLKPITCKFCGSLSTTPVWEK
jgi:hypothetical protein